MSGSDAVPDPPSVTRAAVAALLGAAVAVVVGTSGGWRYASAAGWTVAAGVFVAWTWRIIGRMDAAQTAAHATREFPARAGTDVILLLASIASVGGVLYLLAAEGDAGGGSAQEALSAGLGITSVTAAWLVVHTVFAVRYALLYYSGEPGGIGFNQDEPPDYADFAYLAFTLGMTYQVSDTALGSRTIRRAALRHALLSYVLGAVVLATVVNLVAGLGSDIGG